MCVQLQLMAPMHLLCAHTPSIVVYSYSSSTDQGAVFLSSFTVFVQTFFAS